MKRLKLGLTDYERDQQDQDRRTRNCLIAVAALILIVSAI